MSYSSAVQQSATTNKGRDVINTIVVYGVARTGEDGVPVLEAELYADERLADEASKQPPGVEVPDGPSKVWEFTLVRNLVKSKQDAVEFFQSRNGAAAEVLVPTALYEGHIPNNRVIAGGQMAI